MLINGSFRDNSYSIPPQGISGLMPAPWYIRSYAKKGDPWLEKQGQDWQAPEVLPITYPRQFPEEHLVHDSGDKTIFKVFRGGAPFSIEIAQDIQRLSGEYVFTVPIFPDQWHNINGKLIRPSSQTSDDWYLSSEVKVEAWSGQDLLAATKWLDASQVPIGKYTEVQLVFNVDGPVTLVVGLRGRWGFHQNGAFMDGLTLLPVTSLPPVETIPYKSQVWADMALFGTIKAGLVDGVSQKQLSELVSVETVLKRLVSLPSGANGDG